MKITSKGQVTVPLAVRERCALLPGTEVEFTIRGNEVILKKKESPENQVESWLNKFVGSGDAGLTTDEIMAMTRGED